MAYKVFTNGSTLQASELNENLMQQSIAVFSNAAARTAAITTPVEGQMTYLEDVNLHESYNGSSWASPFGLTLVKTQTIGTSVNTVTVTDAFSSKYDDYLITVSGGSGNAQAILDLEIGGVTSGYRTAYIYGNFSNSVAAVSVTNSTSVPYAGMVDTSRGITLRAEVLSPNLPNSTAINSSGGGAPNAFIGTQTARLENTTQYTSFRIFTSAVITGGVIRVYGYRKVL